MSGGIEDFGPHLLGLCGIGLSGRECSGLVELDLLLEEYLVLFIHHDHSHPIGMENANQRDRFTSPRSGFVQQDDSPEPPSGAVFSCARGLSDAGFAASARSRRRSVIRVVRESHE
jgi:hypothetical protein